MVDRSSGIAVPADALKQSSPFACCSGKVLYRSGMTHGSNKMNFEFFTAVDIHRGHQKQENRHDGLFPGDRHVPLPK